MAESSLARLAVRSEIAEPLLAVSNVGVVYDDVILVLRGLSLA